MRLRESVSLFSVLALTACGSEPVAPTPLPPPSFGTVPPNCVRETRETLGHYNYNFHIGDFEFSFPMIEVHTCADALPATLYTRFRMYIAEQDEVHDVWRLGFRKDGTADLALVETGFGGPGPQWYQFDDAVSIPSSWSAVVYSFITAGEPLGYQGNGVITGDDNIFVELRNQPAAPKNVTVGLVAGSGQDVRVTWLDDGDAWTALEIARSIDGGSYTVLSGVADADEQYVDSSPKSEGSTYTYRLRRIRRLFDSFNASPYIGTRTLTSGATTGSVTIPTVLNAPTLNACAFDGAIFRITCSWTNDGSYAVEISRSTDGGSFAVLDTLSSGTTAYDDLNVGPGHEYAYRVRHVAETSSPYSNTVTESIPTFPTPTLHCDQPYLFQVTVLCTWKLAHSSYSTEVQRRMSEFNWANLATIAPGWSRYEDDDVWEGRTYEYRVRFVSGGSVGPWSNVHSITVQ